MSEREQPESKPISREASEEFEQPKNSAEKIGPQESEREFSIQERAEERGRKN